MKTELAQEIIECLPKERTLFRYYKDYYAAYLLQRVLQQQGPMAVSELRRSRFGRLLNKPIFSELLASSGSGKLNAYDIESLWPSEVESYVLTLATWGNTLAKHYRHFQVSRPGKNLVLQMNFCRRHDELYQRYVLEDLDYFKHRSHPVSQQYCTLAWARIDLDMNLNEALIEEIQNDWLRDMDRLANFIKRWAKGRRFIRYRQKTLEVDKVIIYLNQEMARHQAIWSEAMLSATIQFLHQEIGVSRIYYHTPATGAALKNIQYSKPPRSIYTNLPRQFCFERVNESPAFIAQDKQAKRRLRAIKDQQWFCLTA